MTSLPSPLFIRLGFAAMGLAAAGSLSAQSVSQDYARYSSMLNAERANTAARERQGMYNDATRNSRYSGSTGTSGRGTAASSDSGSSTNAQLVGLLGQSLNNFVASRNERALERQRVAEAYAAKIAKDREAGAIMSAKIMGTDRPLIQQNLEKAAKGDAHAMADAGWQYLQGMQVKKDQTLGLSLIEDAAKHGDSRSMHNLSYWYRTGKDGYLPVNLELSNSWLQKAAAAGDVEAMAVLGGFLQAGNGIAKNLPEALRWDTLAAAKGNAIAAENAAVMLTGGFEGITPDPDRAEAYYRQAIAAGSKSAEDNLLTLLSNMENAVDHSAMLNKAFKLRLQFAQKGDPVHEAIIGLYYLRGYVGPVDIPQAREWFEKAVKHGSNRALYELALLYDEGAPGVAADKDRALDFYRQAAVHGFPEAVYVMGYRTFEGMGVQQDEIEGERLLRLSSDLGDFSAPRILAQIYTDGLGVDANPQEAIKWLRLGVDRGDTQCVPLLEKALAQTPSPAAATSPVASASSSATTADAPAPAHEGQLTIGTVRGYDDAMAELRRTILGLPKREHSRGDAAYNMLAALYAAKKAQAPALSERDFILALHEQAVAGDKEAGYLWGAARLCGFGIRKGPDKEIAGYIGALLEKKPEAWRDYGILLIHGKGVTQDEAKGFAMVKRSADAGIASSQTLEGELRFFGVGTPEDRDAGIALWKKAAEAGDDLGGFDYAQSQKQEHPDVALRYFKRGAEAGDDRSMLYYGWFLVEGRGGPADVTAGTAWLERAARAGNPRAQGKIGRAYAEGNGVPEDITVACLYWEAGARHGDMAAQLNLGIRQVNGDGVPENQESGIAWLRQAAAQGSEEATEQLKTLGVN